MTMASLTPILCGGQHQYTCRVSSTLNRDTKQFGKKYLFDGKSETCWNSDQVNILYYVFSLLKFKGG